jgi:hypothetical protein
MFANRNEIEALICKVTRKHRDKTFLIWGVRSVWQWEKKVDEIYIMMFFSINNDPHGRVTIEKTVSELREMK